MADITVAVIADSSLLSSLSSPSLAILTFPGLAARGTHEG